MIGASSEPTAERAETLLALNVFRRRPVVRIKKTANVNCYRLLGQDDRHVSPVDFFSNLVVDLEVGLEEGLEDFCFVLAPVSHAVKHNAFGPISVDVGHHDG